MAVEAEAVFVLPSCILWEWTDGWVQFQFLARVDGKWLHYNYTPWQRSLRSGQGRSGATNAAQF